MYTAVVSTAAYIYVLKKERVQFHPIKKKSRLNVASEGSKFFLQLAATRTMVQLCTLVDTYSCTCSGTDARGTKFTAVGPVWVLIGTSAPQHEGNHET